MLRVCQNHHFYAMRMYSQLPPPPPQPPSSSHNGTPKSSTKRTVERRHIVDQFCLDPSFRLCLRLEKMLIFDHLELGNDRHVQRTRPYSSFYWYDSMTTTKMTMSTTSTSTSSTSSSTTTTTCCFCNITAVCYCENGSYSDTSHDL